MNLQQAIHKAAKKVLQGRPRERRLYDFNGLGGCVEQRRNRATGNVVGIYDCEQSGVDGGVQCDTDKPNPWATVCEKHGHIVGHRSLAVARSHAADPLGWCDSCREQAEKTSNN